MSNYKLEEKSSSKDVSKRRKVGRPPKKTGEPEKYISFHLRNKNRIDKFEALCQQLSKKDDQFKQTVNVLRYLIDVVYEIEVEGKGQIDLDEVSDRQIKLVLSNDFLRSSYQVSDLKSTINRAVEEWLRNRKSDINLHQFAFRKYLMDDEKKVALAFVQHQMKPEHFKGLSLEELKNYLDTFDVRKINQIVREFVKNGLLLTDLIDGIEYFYAPLP